MRLHLGLAGRYDRWGNLTAANQIPSQTNCAGYLLTASTDGNNHLTGSGYSYDAAGNMTTDSVNTYTYNAENEMTAAGSASYKYDGEGRQVNNSAGTLFWYGLSGQVLAELQGTTNWSDYIYANGQRIAKADNFEYRIHTYGNNCSNCGNQYSGFAFLGPQGYGGYYDYIMQSGDKLCWRQWESGGVGGIMMIFSDGSNTNWVTYDQDGQLMNTDGIQGSWHYRRVDLSAYAGKLLQSINLIQQGNGATGGPWDIYFQDVVLVSADGTVRPLYNRQTGISLNTWGTSGVSGRGYAIDYHTVNDPTTPDDTTNYYTSDALGSERMMTSVDGYPVWQAMYAAFGNEVSPQMTMSDYKFAGLTRDPTTSLDRAMLRTYSSTINRWMTPDPLGGDITNPQSLNRYAYALNNPTTLTDPSGRGPQQTVCIPGYEGSYEPYIQTNNCGSTGNPPSGPGAVTIDSNGDPLSADISEGEGNYASNFGWLVQGSIYGHTIPPTFFSTLNAYFNWRTDLAAQPPNQAYAGYMFDCQHGTVACVGGETVTTRYQGLTGNYTILRDPFDDASTVGMISDPALFSNWEHGGPSWYTWDFINAGHVTAGANGYVEGHYDNWNGVLAAPLHFIYDFLPSLFINPKPGVPGPTYVCAPVGGCH